MKAIINVSIGFVMLGIVGGMEMNSLTIRDSLISLMLLVLFLCLINRKKSATSHTRNGQAHKVHNKLIHKKLYTIQGRCVKWFMKEF